MMKRCLIIVFVSIFFCSSCATPPGPYIKRKPYVGKRNDPISDPRYPQIEVGKEIKIINTLGHYVFSLPSKLILWNWRIDKHWISQSVIDDIEEYLKTNNLWDVKVRINQYNPMREFRRLRKNYRVGAGYRWTFGIIAWINYMIYPGILFGGDCYNPYTDTINIYSDLSSIGYHECGHAKDFARRKLKGTYNLLYMVPIWTEILEYRATKDAIRYTYYKKEKDNELESYKVLFPAFGSYVGGETTNLFMLPFYPVYLGAILGGHVAGRIKAHKRNKYYDKYLTELDK